MRREIKVKIYDKYNKVMSKEFEISEIAFSWNVIWSERFYGQKEIAGCDMVFLQFTGLHDSKGTPIYEGDRIGYSYPDKVEELGYVSCEGIVTFENGCFVVKQEGFDYEKADLPPFTLHEWLMDDDCEVVGESKIK
jgi:hypothetical protein